MHAPQRAAAEKLAQWDWWHPRQQLLQSESLLRVLSSEGNLVGHFVLRKLIKILAVCFRLVSVKEDLLTLLIISLSVERKYVSHYGRLLEIDCGTFAQCASRLIGRQSRR